MTKEAPGSEWLALWMTMWQTAWLAPQVVGHRTLAMMTGTWPPNRRNRREYARMIWEKPEAFTEALLALGTAPLFGAAQAQALLAPVNRRVQANQRRLAAGGRAR
jgi:hypothetical protein